MKCLTLLLLTLSVQGRTPNLKEWEQLIGKVEELHDNLDAIEFEWTEQDEQEES